MYKEINDFINSMTDGDLVLFCNDIYDWNSTGNLDPDSHLYKLSKSYPCPNAKYVADLVIDRSVERLEKIVLLLFKENPSKFLKNTSNK